MNRLESGEVDLLISVPGLLPAGLHARSLYSEPLVLVQRRDHPRGSHPLTARSYCSLDHVVAANTTDTTVIPTAAPALRSHLERLAARPFGELVFLVQEAAPRWCERAGVKAQIAIEGRECAVPASLSDVLGGVLSHLVRNAIAHGIEAPAKRMEVGKPELGTIHVRCESNDAGVRIVVEDDGAGIDEEGLRKSAAEKGIAADTADLVQLVALAGLSTREEADELSGQGVGLDAVTGDLENAGYRLSVTTERGRGTQFSIIPSGKGSP